MTSPYLTSSEAAIYLRFVNAAGAPDTKRTHAYVTRALPKDAIKWRGRRMLISRAAIDAALEGSSR